jgi:predicted AAA+ superfamily ATPase
VLTGSTRYSVLPQAAQSLTGRAHVINVLPLSQGELHGRRENFIDRLWADPDRLPEMPSRPVTRDEYADRILTGGFPMILQCLTTRARTSWFADYVDEVDLVLETWDGRVAGFEVKAGSRVQDTDLSGLRLLRDRLGERFMAGFLLNLGELAYRKEEKIMIMPLSGLWSLASSQTASQRSARSVSLSFVRWRMDALADTPMTWKNSTDRPYMGDPEYIVGGHINWECRALCDR